MFQYLSGITHLDILRKHSSDLYSTQVNAGSSYVIILRRIGKEPPFRENEILVGEFELFVRQERFVPFCDSRMYPWMRWSEISVMK